MKLFPVFRYNRLLKKIAYYEAVLEEITKDVTRLSNSLDRIYDLKEIVFNSREVADDAKGVHYDALNHCIDMLHADELPYRIRRKQLNEKLDKLKNKLDRLKKTKVS